MEKDVETIALNRTAIAFSHGNDTFGWRFYPRVQTPPTPGTLGAFAETLLGGPSEDKDMKGRQLEPGMRECTAIVVMPSFLTSMRFHTRVNWFGLTNPRKKELTLHDSMKLSRTYQHIQEQMQCVSDSPLYRPGDIAEMTHVVNQLDRRMPLQTTLVDIPYENTSGGFELFSGGVTALGPELMGWHGAPSVLVADCKACARCEAEKTVVKTPKKVDGKEAVASAPAEETVDLCSCGGTNVFLVGKNFSVHDTKVIAGGVCIPKPRLLSREIMQVTIPANVRTLSRPNKETKKPDYFVDVRIATPYGMTNELLIPAQLATKKVEAKADAKLTKTISDAATKAAKEEVAALNKSVRYSLAWSSKSKLAGLYSYPVGNPAQVTLTPDQVPKTLEFTLSHYMGKTNPPKMPHLHVVVWQENKSFSSGIPLAADEVKVTFADAKDGKRGGTIVSESLFKKISENLKIAPATIKEGKPLKFQVAFYLVTPEQQPELIHGSLPMELVKQPKAAGGGSDVAYRRLPYSVPGQTEHATAASQLQIRR